MTALCSLDNKNLPKRSLLLTLLHSERPKLYANLAVLSAIGLKEKIVAKQANPCL